MNHYELGETIGSGSFGKVKKARHKITGHEGTVKTERNTEFEFFLSRDQDPQQKEDQIDGSREQDKKRD